MFDFVPENFPSFGESRRTRLGCVSRCACQSINEEAEFDCWLFYTVGKARPSVGKAIKIRFPTSMVDWWSRRGGFRRYRWINVAALKKLSLWKTPWLSYGDPEVIPLSLASECAPLKSLRMFSKLRAKEPIENLSLAKKYQSLLTNTKIACRKCFVIRGISKKHEADVSFNFFPVPSIHQREKPCLRNASFYSSVDTTLSQILSDKTFLTFLSSNLRHEVIGIWTLSGRANKKWVKINIFAFVWRLVKCAAHSERNVFICNWFMDCLDFCLLSDPLQWRTSRFWLWWWSSSGNWKNRKTMTGCRERPFITSCRFVRPNSKSLD